MHEEKKLVPMYKGDLLVMVEEQAVERKEKYGWARLPKKEGK